MKPGYGIMPKRFTDTGIWVDKPWFAELTPPEKCAWFFIKDRCDSTGVWTPHYKMGDIMIGEKIDWEKLLEKLNNNIEILPNGKWWLVDFCSYQYGTLTPTCKPHKAYIEILKKHGLYDRVCKGIYTLQEKEKDKELEKELEKEKDKSGAEAKECLDYYFAKHKAPSPEGCGFEPMMDWPRDMKMFKRIMKNYDVPGLKEVIDAFFEWPTRSDFTTRALYNKVDTLHGVLKRKAEGKR